MTLCFVCKGRYFYLYLQMLCEIFRNEIFRNVLTLGLIKPKDRLNHYGFSHTLGNNGFLPRKFLLPAYGAKTATTE